MIFLKFNINRILMLSYLNIFTCYSYNYKFVNTYSKQKGLLNINNLKDKKSDIMNEGIRTINSTVLKITTFDKISWAFNITDTRPYKPESPIGVAFLITNLGYLFSSFKFWDSPTLSANLFASLVDFAGVISFIYHYTQLQYGTERYEVKLALFVDYLTALITVGSSLVIIASFAISGYILDPHIILSIKLGSLSLLLLFISWIQYGINYLFFHGLWHVVSSFAVDQIGQAEKMYLVF